MRLRHPRISLTNSVEERRFGNWFPVDHERCLTFAPTRGRAKRLTEARRFSPVAVGRAVRPQPRQDLNHDASTLTSFMRPDAPDLMDTAALRHWKCSATKAMSSSLALPSTGGDFSLASQVPSAACAIEEVRALGFTLIRMNTVAISTCGLTFALNGASKGAKRRLRASVFQRVVRQHSLYLDSLNNQKSNPAITTAPTTK